MSDFVERLRNSSDPKCHLAANEIERLREVLKSTTRSLEMLRKDRRPPPRIGSMQQPWEDKKDRIAKASVDRANTLLGSALPTPEQEPSDVE